MVRAGLLASRVRTKLTVRLPQTGLPRNYPVAGCKFPRLQLRGSAGFSPASLPVKADKDAQTKEVVKELNWIVGKIYSLAERKSINSIF